MKTSELLRSAKPFLSHMPGIGICAAVWAVPVDTEGAALKKSVTDEISRRLHPYMFATTWLGAQVLFGRPHRTQEEYVQARQWREAQDPEDIQAWRHRWLDKLIQEYESKGD